MVEYQSDSKQKTFRILLAFIKPHTFWLVINLIFVGMVALCNIFWAYALKFLTDSALGKNMASVSKGLCLMLVLTGVWLVASFISIYSNTLFNARTIRDIRSRVTRHMINVPVSIIQSGHSGDALSRLTNDISVLQMLLGELEGYIFEPLLFTGAFIYMSFINWKLLLFSMVVLPIAMLLSDLLFKPIGKYSELVQKHLGEVNTIAQDTINGVYVLKAFNLKEVLYDKFKSAVDRYLHYGINIEKRRSLVAPISIFIKTIPLVLCVTYGGYLAVKGEMTAGELLAVLSLLSYIIGPVTQIPRLVGTYRQGMGGAKRVFEILDYPVENTGGHSSNVDYSQTALVVDNISFSYQDNVEILNDLSFGLSKGKLVALIGPSGSGKSTIINLLCGFYQPSRGSIKLFGKTQQEWDLAAYREQISLVSQDIYLFPGTIAENISYGRQDFTMGDIINAAKEANAHSFIMQMPEGYNTPVGERGIKLSGGQRQRIALARAILKDAPIFLLDEATSAQDSHSEESIYGILKSRAKTRWILVVAHRLSVAKQADEILVLDKGRIIESGIHEELIQKNGLYRKLYLRQFLQEGHQHLRSSEEGV